MSDAAALYRGRTVHVRFAPFTHRLAYDVYQILIDIDRTAEIALGAVFAVNRFALLSFHDTDHGDRSGAPLRPWVEARLREAGIETDGGPIRLLCFPRVLGFVFNPISVFFCHRRDGALAGVVYEVNNTFGDTHSYVAPATGAAVERQVADKVLHVSPFFDVSGRYAFTLRPPEASLSLVIDKWVDGVRDHVATLKATRQPFSTAALLRAFFSVPLLTVQVVAGIHWEALKLWIKGARYHPRPAPPVPASTGRAASPSRPPLQH